MQDYEPRCCSMHDPAGRRGIWYTVRDGVFYLCAGREGDDAEVSLKPGQVVTEEKIILLCQSLDYGAYMQEEHGPDAETPRRFLPASMRG